VKEYIANTMTGMEYLWGAPVKLETSEIVKAPPKQVGVFSAGFAGMAQDEPVKTEIKWERVLYTMKDRKLSREVIQ
jgi:stage V sporulation protein R